MTDTPLRLAMWSGPRNISTAMMRSWGNRPDTVVCDEPLYAHYLRVTGLDHPGAAETLAAHDADWRRVVRWLTGPLPDGKRVFYQKHMAHHLLPGIEREWLEQLTHCFLIRQPEDMLTSLLEFLPRPRLEDTGLPQQVEIFDRIREGTGELPPVLDARDVLLAPQPLLTRLCRRVGLEFDPAMLRWPAGPRETDGAWARYWYGKVEQTTRFGEYQPKSEQVPEHLLGLLAECRPLYEYLHRHRLTE